MKNNKLFSKWRIWLREKIIYLMKLRGSKHEIALGFAIGVFIGVFPTFGFGLVLVSLLAVVIRFNVPAALLGSLLGNPFFSPFWLLSSYFVGNNICKLWHSCGFLSKINLNWLGKILNITFEYLVGNIFISVFLSVISYFVVYFGLDIFRKKKCPQSELNGQHSQ